MLPKKCSGQLLRLRTKSCPTGEISQLQKPESETDRIRRLTLRVVVNLARGRTERRRVAITRSRSRALARVGVRRTAQNTRAETCRLHAARRTGCAPQDVPVARRKTCHLHAARRAGCAPEDVPVARRKTCRLHAGRRAVARRKTCRCTPGAQTRKCAGARSVQARGPREHAGAQSRGATGRPVRPFSSRSGLPELCGRAAGREASRPAWPPGAQGVPRAPEGTCQTLEPKPGRREVKVPPGFEVLFLLSLSQKRSRKEAKHTKEARRVGSRVRRARVCWVAVCSGKLYCQAETHTKGKSNNRQSFPKHRPLLSRVRKNALTRPYRDQGGMDDFRGLSE